LITTLFWNLGKQNRDAVISRLIHRYSVDVLVLAECPIPDGVVVSAIERLSGRRFYTTASLCEKISVFVGSPEINLEPVSEAARYTIRRLTMPDREEIFLACAHLISKRDASSESQSLAAVALSDAIRRVESQSGHERTILVGDLNMDPFESGLVGANTLNAVMSRTVASGGARVVQKDRHPFFYNPMWSLFGDHSAGPPGTHYYYRAEHVSYYWHMFDQVLVRPDLLSRFRNEELEIVTSDGVRSLLTDDGRPERKVGSDHLPVVFRIHLSRE
jgi:hypothetical protein